MSDFLQQMALASRERAAAIRAEINSAALDLPILPLKLRGFDLIAEIKDSSPSEGALAKSGADRAARARDYAAGGAAAISVLTEPSKFSGDLAHLRDVVSAVSGRGIPVMRKDFLVDPLQVLEARDCGASGILLIAAMLSDVQLQSMLACAYEHSMFVLLEAFDESDLDRCNALLESDRHLTHAQDNSLLIGINSRNLRTLAVDPGRLAKLSSQLPENTVCVAESGIANAQDAAKARELGYGVALVGTALMKSEKPAKLIAEMLDAGRRKVAA